MLEMGLKVLVYGFHNYWRSAQNQFDFIITVTIGTLTSISRIYCNINPDRGFSLMRFWLASITNSNGVGFFILNVDGCDFDGM